MRIESAGQIALALEKVSMVLTTFPGGADDAAWRASFA